VVVEFSIRQVRDLEPVERHFGDSAHRREDRRTAADIVRSKKVTSLLLTVTFPARPGSQWFSHTFGAPDRTNRAMTSPTLRPHSFLLSTSLAGILMLFNPRGAYAESSASYKYEDYRESDGRIAVKTQSARVDQDIDSLTHLKVEGVIDAIAGATPNGQPAPVGSDQVVLTNMDDRRKAWNVDLSRQVQQVNVDAGFANSRESDYVSNGWSLNTLTSFNEKDTTLLAGVAGTRDTVKVFYQSGREKKRTNDLILGVTQLLDPHTSIAVNASWSRATGYLSDPYKLVQKGIEVDTGVFLPFTFGENRPNERTKWTVLASLNRDFPAAHGAVEATYRYSNDTFGTNAHTIDLNWLQHLGEQFILKPEFRFYDQHQADFYHYNLDTTSIIPTGGAPHSNGPFYSSDYRLSALRSYLFGLKAIWTPTQRWQIDAAIESYDMRGKDNVTVKSAYPRAKIVTVGAKFSW
jgi:hypothetical protein